MIEKKSQCKQVDQQDEENIISSTVSIHVA